MADSFVCHRGLLAKAAAHAREQIAQDGAAVVQTPPEEQESQALAPRLSAAALQGHARIGIGRGNEDRIANRFHQSIARSQGGTRELGESRRDIGRVITPPPKFPATNTAPAP